ncbi:MAG: hypothetical protein OXF11_12650 [Deltaproteobacteria bacterium]|nr:hypothetical protein [Deltaproteobacteria bacterium]
MVPWDIRDHGDAQQDLAFIARDVESSGLPKPGSSGLREIPIMNPKKDYPPRTVYVGKRCKSGRHPHPWYIHWGGTSRFCFASCSAVVRWLRISGF